MISTRKVISTVVALLVVGSAVWFGTAPAKAGKVPGLSCVIDVLVETRGSTGTVSTTSYHKEFSLTDGQTFSDDFSTATRFKFFDAALTKVNGEWRLAVDWFADTTVFNSVDFSTAVVLANGQKTGSGAGTHTFFTSGQSTQTSYSIACVEN